MNSGSVLDFGWSDTLPPPCPSPPGGENLSSDSSPVQRLKAHRGWWESPRGYRGGPALWSPETEEHLGFFIYLNVKIQNSQDHRDDDNKPVESSSSGSSSTWTFFGHFLSPQSLRKIHVRGRRPHRRTENCRHRYDQFGTESKGLSIKKEKKSLNISVICVSSWEFLPQRPHQVTLENLNSCSFTCHSFRKREREKTADSSECWLSTSRDIICGNTKSCWARHILCCWGNSGDLQGEVTDKERQRPLSASTGKLSVQSFPFPLVYVLTFIKQH